MSERNNLNFHTCQSIEALTDSLHTSICSQRSVKENKSHEFGGLSNNGTIIGNLLFFSHAGSVALRMPMLVGRLIGRSICLVLTEIAQ